MGMPKWECLLGSHMKIKMGPSWDLHGNAKVRMPRCVPCENKDESQLGPTWECPRENDQVCPI